jgi:hypothetical protein
MNHKKEIAEQTAISFLLKNKYLLRNSLCYFKSKNYL